MIKLLKKLTKKDMALAGLAFLLILAQVYLNLTMPDYMSDMTVLVQTEGSAMADILAAGGKMLLCAVGSLLTAACIAVCAAKISANFSANLRGQVFNRVQSFSMEEIGRFSTSSLITRSTNDITQVQMVLVLGLEVFLKAPVTAVWAICKIAGKSWQWTATTGIAVIILLCIVGTCVMVAMPKFRKLQILTDNINRVTRENLTGLRVVRAYNAEDYQETKFEKANDELKRTQLFANRTMTILMPGIMLVMNGLTLAVYWVGAYLINDAGMQDKLTLFSDMIVFSQYAMQVGMTGEVEFRHVSFKYPDAEKNVLEDITFTAHKGDTVAFIGSTGCGKSTVINLIPRFYDTTEGEVLVDGMNVKEYTQEALRNRIGYVSQKAILFSGTVAGNVAYGENGGKPADREDIIDAVHTAQADEFVEKLPDTYDGFVAQGGSNLSGGQKQRLSIARAICRHPEIMIFDDSFSALDYKTDRILRKALDEKCGDTTRLIVAQRIGTIRDADKIIVLDEGRIAGMGTHDELMKNCEVYRQIAFSQLSKEELA